MEKRTVYKLKIGLECAQFMRAVDRCRGLVLLKTARGDTLNLKSDLSRFVFVSAFGNTNLMLDATLELTDPGDYACLANCVTHPKNDNQA